MTSTSSPAAAQTRGTTTITSVLGRVLFLGVVLALLSSSLRS